MVEPYCLELAESPHLAAAEAGVQINLEVICEAYAQLASTHEWVLVEGAAAG